MQQFFNSFISNQNDFRFYKLILLFLYMTRRGLFIDKSSLTLCLQILDNLGRNTSADIAASSNIHFVGDAAPIARTQCHVYCPVKPGSLYKRCERCFTLDWGQQVSVDEAPQDETIGKSRGYKCACSAAPRMRTSAYKSGIFLIKCINVFRNVKACSLVALSFVTEEHVTSIFRARRHIREHSTLSESCCLGNKWKAAA
jgi:hypothetical protein